jgi:RNA polymerase sigma factor (sigma-70 family)
MRNGQADTLLHYVRTLAVSEATSQLPDRELLGRFTGRHDETAFAALLRRHGPMVLGVCRRVLPELHDAEDVFQATFLVLLRKASTIAWQESVGNWLYQVAYRLALETKTTGARRRCREGLLEPRPPGDPMADLTWREAQRLLDEELNRLPEKYRAPLVLCYLEGATRDEAARQLGWSLGTLRRRLGQGRQRLQARLVRRGLTLSIPLGATLLGPAAVPAALAHATTRAVLSAGPGTPPVPDTGPSGASLVRGGGNAVGLPRTLSATLVLLALGLLALGVGLVFFPPAAGKPAQVPGGESSPPPTQGKGPRPRPGPALKTKTPEQMLVTGRVLGPNGKAMPRAQVAVLAVRERLHRFGSILGRQLLGEGRADAEGNFRLTVPRTSSDRYRGVDVLAAGPGAALGWQSFDLDDPRPKVVVRLGREQIIRGRLVDLQGRPAAKAQLRLTGVHRPTADRRPPGVLGTPFDRAAGRKGISLSDRPARFLLWPGPVTTDHQGRFVLRGLGGGVRVSLVVQDKRFAPFGLSVDTRDKDRAQNVKGSLAPANVLRGRVTYADTRKPVARARVIATYGQGWTDKDGRFQLNIALLRPGGGGNFFVMAYAPPGEPYLITRKSFRWEKGQARQTVQMSLRRGVLVRGKVVEAGSGKPVAGARVTYYPRGYLTGSADEKAWRSNVSSAPDGTFQIPCFAGPCHLLVDGPTPVYIRQEVGVNELNRGKPGGQRWYAHGIVPLDLGGKSGPVRARVKLRRGVTIDGRLQGPDGKRVGRAQMLCRLNPDWHAAVNLREGRFRLCGCDPKVSYAVYFLEAANRQGAAAELSARQAKGKPVTVRLAPLGTFTARLLDPAGKPRPNFHPWLFLVLTPANGMLLPDTIPIATPFRPDGPATDAKGNYTYSWLIPGATYQFGYGFIRKQIKAGAGKTVRLGEITVRGP